MGSPAFGEGDLGMLGDKAALPLRHQKPKPGARRAVPHYLGGQCDLESQFCLFKIAHRLACLAQVDG